MGVFYLAIPVGTALGYLLGGFLGPKYGWRMPFYVGAAPGSSWLSCCWFVPEPPLDSSTMHSTKHRSGHAQRARTQSRLPDATFGMAMMTFALAAAGLDADLPAPCSRIQSARSKHHFWHQYISNGLVASLAAVGSLTGC